MAPTFICIRGPAQTFAFEQVDLFGVTDDQGRPWLCWPVPNDASLGLAIEEIEADLERFYAAMRKRGSDPGRTSLAVITHVRGREVLPLALAVS